MSDAVVAAGTAEPLFVGRQRELGELTSALDRASGRLQVVVLRGTSGIGKTRLLRELQRIATSRGSIALYGRGRPFGQAHALEVFAEAFAMLDLHEPAQRKRLAAIDGLVAGEVGRRLAALRPFLGANAISGDDIDAQRSSGLFAEGMLRVFEALAEPARPVVIAVDDLQWVDVASLELLIHVADKAKPVPMLIVCASRDEGPDETHRLLPEAAAIDLDPLTISAARGLVSHYVGADLPALAAQLRQWSGGRPFQMLQMLRTLGEHEAFERRDGGWTVNPHAVARLTQKRDVFALLADRIAVLAAETREVLSIAALAGGEVTTNLLTHALIAGGVESRIARVAPANAIHAGLTGGLVVPSGDGYRIAHDQVREALLHAIPRDQLPHFHRRVAMAIERTAVPGADLAYDLAYHYGRSDDVVSAVRYAIEAGVAAVESFAHEKAIGYLDTARMRWDELPPVHQRSDWFVRMLEASGDANVMIGRYSEALSAYQDALFHQPSAVDLARLDSKIGGIHFRRGDITAAVDTLEAALFELGEPQPRTRRAALWSIAREIVARLWIGGDVREQEVDERAMAICRLYSRLEYALFFHDTTKTVAVHLRYLNFVERNGIAAELGHVHSAHAVVSSSIPLVARAIRFGRDGVERESAPERAWHQARSRVHLEVGLHTGGHFREAVAEGLAATREFRRLGDLWELGATLALLSFHRFECGEWTAAEEAAREALAIADRTGASGNRGLAVTALGNLVARTGVELCLAEVEKTLPACRAANDVFNIAGLLRVRGQIELRCGNATDAVDSLGEAVTLLRTSGVRNVWAVTAYPAYALACAAAAAGGDRAAVKRARAAVRAAMLVAWWFPPHRPALARARAAVAVLDRRIDAARRLYRRARELALTGGMPYEEAMALFEEGSIDPERGRNLLHAAGRIYSTLGAVDDVERVIELTGAPVRRIKTLETAL